MTNILMVSSRQTRIFGKLSAVSAVAAAAEMVENAESIGPVNAEPQRSRGHVKIWSSIQMKQSHAEFESEANKVGNEANEFENEL